MTAWPPPSSPPAPAGSSVPRGRRFGLGAVIAAALLGAALAGAGALVANRARHATDGVHAAAPAVTMYRCPMHASVIQDHPGQCPICGMTLVKVDQAPSGPAPASPARPGDPGARAAVPGMAAVEIDPDRQQLIGLKIAEVTRGLVGGAWRTVGRVAMDETRVRHVNLKVPGFVERIYVDFIGKKVRKGDPLFSIYSPELLAAQEEYLLALKTSAALAKAGGPGLDDGAALVAAARRKLALWDIPEVEIDRLAKSGAPTKTLTLVSPVSGVVTRKDVVEGMKLEAGAMPYEIVDLSSVWVLADVYESELRFVKPSLTATLRLNAFPNREFKGKVVFIDPLLDPKTRTVKVRLTFPNPTGDLRPEMFGEVVLHEPPHEGLWIPPDAVIDSGTDKLVFVAIGEGKFSPRKVKLGESDGLRVAIIDGLDQGERVVTRANFLIDSESRLRASLAEMSPPAAAAHGPERARVLPAPASDRSHPEPAP